MNEFSLALGSGAARGYAHIGVLLALEERGLEPMQVVGTSFGALVGGLWAAGYTAEELADLATSARWREVLSRFFDPAPPRPGLIAGRRVEAYYRELLSAKSAERIEDFPRPFAAVCADLVSEKKIVLTQGDAARAIRASGSIAGIFAPVKWGSWQLVDGGLVEPVPWPTALELGAERVLAVNVSPSADAVPAIGWGRRLLTSRFGRGIHASWRKRGADHWMESMQRAIALVTESWIAPIQSTPPERVVCLRVDASISWVDFTRSSKAIEAGYRQATELLERLDWGGN